MEFQDGIESAFFAGILAMTSVHGVVLILVLAKRVRTRANRYLALALLAICIILGYEATEWLVGYEAIPEWLDWLPIYIRSAIPAGTFYFVLFLIRPDHQLKALE